MIWQGGNPNQCFNPRSYERSDNGIPFLQDYQIVSIHAPTKGATCSALPVQKPPWRFNPRSYERSDQSQPEQQ